MSGVSSGGQGPAAGGSGTTAKGTHARASPLTITLSLKNILIHPLVLHLYPYHFTFGNDIQHSYVGPLREFLEALLQRRLPECSAGLFEDSDWFEGKIHVEIWDHRITLGSASPAARAPILTKFTLSPTIDFVRSEWAASPPAPHATSDSQWDTMLLAEGLILPVLCPLDLAPPSRPITPALVRRRMAEQASEAQHPAPPARSPGRRTHRTCPPHVLGGAGRTPYQHADSSPAGLTPYHPKPSSLAKAASLNPKFNALSFIQEWRHKRDLAAQEIMLPLGVSEKKRRKSVATSQSSLNREKTLRTISFISKAGGTPRHTLLNIMETPSTTPASGTAASSTGPSFEGILRWGLTEGAGQGGTIRFPIGNKVAVEYYIAHFKGFYGMNHTLVHDSAKGMGAGPASAGAGHGASGAAITAASASK